MSVKKFENVVKAELPSLNLPNIDALMKDYASVHNGMGPITFGLFRMSKGEPLSYLYEFDEYKLLLEGEIIVTDDSGTDTHLKPGDVMQFSKGANVKFSSPSTGLAFYVAQR